MAEKRSRGLGRGLSALMADLGGDLAADVPPGPEAPRADLFLSVSQLRPNPDQPRRSFDEASLDDLAQSLTTRGVIQPLIVRPDPSEPDAFQIVAGERRYRAAMRAGFARVPVVVREYGDMQVLEIAIIENVQRADLNAIDEGAAYRALMDRFGHTQEQVAAALGKSRSHVANQMRLLALPSEVQAMVEDGRLSAGHARPLIGHPRAAELAARIAEKALSAREAERLAKAPEPSATPRPPRAEKDADTRSLEAELAALLKMGVRIDPDARGEGGRLTITYRTLEQLDDLLRALSG